MKSSLISWVLLGMFVSGLSVSDLFSAETSRRPVEAELKAMADGITEKAPRSSKNLLRRDYRRSRIGNR